MTQSVEAPVDTSSLSPTPNDLHNPATSSILERRPRTLKDGNTFAMFDHYGDIIGSAHSPVGLYHDDTRHLSHTELLLNGNRMLLLSSTIQHDNAVLSVDLANADIYADNKLALSREMLHITRTKFLWNGCCHERIGVFNFDQSSHQLRLTFRFAVDFADLFEVRGATREHHGSSRIEHPSDNAVLFRYKGLDSRERITRIDFVPAPASLNDKEAVFNISLAPHERASFFIVIRCNGEQPAKERDFFSSIHSARRALRRSVDRAATIETSNAVFNRTLSRSMADLYMLITQTPEGPYPYAGIPWFSTPFGRDGIITALQMLWIDAGVARGVLNFLAATQAKTEDAQTEAEPGKILHETRRGEMANLGEVPFGLYYGSIDATPLFVLLAGKYYERTGDRETIERLWPNIEAALRWIDVYGDIDHDGFVEYSARGRKRAYQSRLERSRPIPFPTMTDVWPKAPSPCARCKATSMPLNPKRPLMPHARPRKNGGDARPAGAGLQARFESAFWCDDLGNLCARA